LYVKSDVYGFGVVLLEMLTGLRAHDPNRTSDSQNLVLYAKLSLSHKNKLKKIMDSRLGELHPLEGACQAAQLILRCLESDPKKCPPMEEVLEELENINTIKMKTKEIKASAKLGSNRRQEEHTKHQHRYNHHRSPIHQKNGFFGARARAYHH
jgi:serine/threonine protein kinase